MNRKRIKNLYQDNKEIIWAVVIACLLIFGVLALPINFSSELTLLGTIGVRQLYLSAVAFLVIFITLVLTMSRFRKSMAKPKLHVIFSETMDSKTTLSVPQNAPQGQQIDHELKLLVNNNGNAITKLFQIDFIIPSIYQPRLEAWSQLSLGVPNAPLIPHPDIDKENSIVSLLNPERLHSFVNRPLKIPSILISLYPDRYEEYRDFEIKYRIYGDWAETQEGKLKVICKKKQEVS